MRGGGVGQPLAVLQISDLHLLERPGDRLLNVNTTASLNAVLDAAFAQRRPAALLVTGDIGHEPERKTYERCLGLLRERHSGPLLCLPGNHDRLAPMLAAGLPTAPLTLGRWWVAGWDTHADEQAKARFNPADWQALRSGVEAAVGAGVPFCLIATHHPLIDLGCPWLDKDKLDRADELLECLAGMASVRALAFGHAHQVVDGRYGRLRLLGAPSTCFQFKPGAKAFAVDDAAPGYRWLHLFDDGRLRTEVRRAEGFPMTIDLSQRKMH